jgi:hypothetical protein
MSSPSKPSLIVKLKVSTQQRDIMTVEDVKQKREEEHPTFREYVVISDFLNVLFANGDSQIDGN